MHPSDPPRRDGKAALRRARLASRAGLTPATLATAGRALAGHLRPLCADARTVAAYAAVGSEPSTTQLLAELTGVRVLLPVLLADGDLDWALHAPGRLRTAARGLLEPAGPRLGPEALADCDVVLVPALAVDRAGHRLGRGGGSYDRALPRARGLVVALLHDGELVEQLPTEPHDIAVRAVVTPSGRLVHLPRPG